MKHFRKTHFTILLILAVLQSGCTRDKPTYETIADNAVDIMSAIEEGLPTECKTDTNKLLFNVGRKEIKNIKTSCDEQVQKITREKRNWQVMFWLLSGLIAVFIARKIIK